MSSLCQHETLTHTVSEYRISNIYEAYAHEISLSIRHDCGNQTKGLATLGRSSETGKVQNIPVSLVSNFLRVSEFGRNPKYGQNFRPRQICKKAGFGAELLCNG